MSFVGDIQSFVTKHKVSIAVAFAAIIMVVIYLVLRKKENYYDYESSVTIPGVPAWVQGDPEKSPVLARA